MLNNSLRTAFRIGRLPLRSVRWNSTANDQIPPLLLTMRSDLKTAMKAKDKIKCDRLPPSRTGFRVLRLTDWL